MNTRHDTPSSFADKIKVLFGGPDGYRHEKFTDALLDSLSTEASARAAVVAALKCKGVAQDTVDNFAYEYTQRIQGCNSAGPFFGLSFLLSSCT